MSLHNNRKVSHFMVGSGCVAFRRLIHHMSRVCGGQRYRSSSPAPAVLKRE